MCAYTMKAGWKVGQASHRAYYSNKAAFHFLGKTAAGKVSGTEYNMSVHLMTAEMESHTEECHYLTAAILGSVLLFPPTVF